MTEKGGIRARMPPVNAGSGCGTCETGTVDSRDAVAERTGRYSQRVPVLQVPLPPIRLHVPVAEFQGESGKTLTTLRSFDPTLLLENAKMDMDSRIGQYIRTFELFDKSARIDLTQAHLNAEWKGLLNGAPVSTARNGWSESFIRLAINLYGAPPLSGKDYAAYRAKMDVETIVGAGLAVRLPTGQYMDDKLINLGENRFVFRPQLGVLHTRNHWTVEGTAEVAFYTDNDDFFNGKRLEQKPL